MTKPTFNLHLLLALLFLSPFVFAQNYPSRPSSYVNDFADILDDQTEQRIAETLSELKQSRDVEMMVVTIKSVSDYGFEEEIEPFATGLFNFWGIGDATRNDGMLMLVATKDRAMRIELGTGYPSHLDRTAQTIINEIMIPQFKNGNVADGIEKGVIEASHLISLDSPQYLQTNSEYSSEYNNEHSNDDKGSLNSILQWGAGILTSLFGIFGFNKWRRRRPRHCPTCQSTMILLAEEQEDGHLTKGQQTEERINSIQYDVWYCQADKTVQVCNYQQWFSGYCKCKYCNNKTLGSSAETIKAATEYNTGTSRVTFTCEHCNKNWIELHTIPRVTRSDSSSSSSSSGSSGGQSSGGGASGRW